jgi:NitT/TauT family transport system ATP-binding protein
MSQPAQGVTPPESSSPFLEVDKICQDFSAQDGSESARVLWNVSFTASRQETVCILGPSGCGKSTILRAVSGMYQRNVKMPTSGEVRIRGARVTEPHDDVLTVFQRPVLKAWLNVRDNIGLPFRSTLWGDKVPAAERKARVDTVLDAIGMTESAHLYPRQLSGGMQQRVSLAARLVLRPAIMCLDEPFSALDAQTRQDMQNLVLKLWQSFPCLALFVTHDVSEALRIADRIIVLSTRPATVVMDVTVAEPKPRADAWFRSEECLKIEQDIIARIREAGGAGAKGTLRVDV